VATDAAGDVYVSDSGNDRVQMFVTPATIALISDVGRDQGGQARIRFLRCSADDASSSAPIVRYDIFRRIDPLGTVTTPSSPSANEPATVELAGWEQVGSVSAYAESEYNAVVPTLENATASSLYYTAFMVRAATATPSLYFDSAVAYGYSVDNLSPPAPNPFVAAYSGGATHLHWGVSPAGDFSSFRLYRGSSADFVPGATNLVIATADTGYTDVGPAGGYYKLTAADRNGNEGAFASVGPDQTTAVPGAPGPVLTLERPRPNPTLAGSLTMHFVLPVAGPARLELLDVDGRRTRVWQVGGLGAGAHAVDLAQGQRLRSGLYFARLVQGANEKVVRITVLE